MEITAIRISWWDNSDSFDTSDGYSLHRNEEDARRFLHAEYSRDERGIANPFGPMGGWDDVVFAQKVLVPADSLLARTLAEKPTLRIERLYRGAEGELYRGAGRLQKIEVIGLWWKGNPRFIPAPLAARPPV